MKYTLTLPLKHLLLAVTCVLLPQLATAQVVNVDLDKKVIIVDSLNLPPNTSVLSALNILPEILQRPGGSLLSNYDIQVEDISLGKNCDAALSQLQLIDIEKIEVSESPISTYNNNGQGGSVNILLRDKGRHGENLWGSVGVAGFSPLEFQPQFTIGYRKEKFMVRGLLLGENYNYSSDTKVNNYTGGRLTDNKLTTEDYRLRSQLANAYLQFKPNAKNRIKWNVAYNYNYSKDKLNSTANDLTANTVTQNNTYLKSDGYTLQTVLNYLFQTKRFALETEVKYAYTPTNTKYDEPLVRNYDNSLDNHNVSGKIELKGSLLSPDCAATLFLTTGVNGNANFEKEETDAQDVNQSIPSKFNPDLRNHYLMPYVKLESRVGLFRLQAVGEWQHYDYHIDYGEQLFDRTRNNFTGQFIGEVHFTPHRCLRVIYERKLQRPTEEQIYPYLHFNGTGGQYVAGNQYLTPMLSHQVKLNYVADRHWNGQSIQFDASAGYIRTSDIINPYQVGGEAATGGLGMTLQYLTYRNNSHSDIAFGNLMMAYSYRILNVMFTAEVYNNHTKMDDDGTTNHYTYYNMSLLPSLQFRHGWNLSASVIYYSQVKQNNQTLGSHTIGSLTVGKLWQLGGCHSLYAYIYGRASMTGRAKDKTWSEPVYTERLYELSQNTIGAGVKYCF